MTTKQDKLGERLEAAHEMRIVCDTAKKLVLRMEAMPGCLSLAPELRIMLRTLGKQADHFAELSREADRTFNELIDAQQKE